MDSKQVVWLNPSKYQTITTRGFKTPVIWSIILVEEIKRVGKDLNNRREPSFIN